MSFKTSCLILVVFYCSTWISNSFGRPAGGSNSSRDDMDAINYLTQYGYLAVPDARAGQLRSYKDVTHAIRMFQMYAGIPMTGKADNKTMEMIAMPRCGMSDFGRSDGARRRRRYAVQGSTWSKRSLTYKYINGPAQKSISMEQVKEQMDKAFKEWESHTDLKFTETSNYNADIHIRFSTGNHEDGYPFDGVGGTLAHGFYPLDNSPGLPGDVHFDDDETWVLSGAGSGTDFYWTALHEIGHSLGLDHSNYKQAVMYPFYTGFKKELKLNKDDIEGIRQLYGMPKVTIQTAPPAPGPTKTVLIEKHQPNANPCSASFDAVFADDKSDITYFFAGKYYWTVHETGQRYGPYLVNETWSNLPAEGIDAAYQSKGKTKFFKGKQCWVYNGTELMKGPVDISEEFGLPDSIERIDAAFVWGANGKTYLFKDDLYWRYNEALDSLDMGYPLHINKSWNGVPSNLDSAMTWINGKTYFFKGNDFWLFDNMHFTVTDFKPMNTNMYWMKCSERDLNLDSEVSAGIPHTSSSVVLILGSALAASLSPCVKS